jgi:tRNA A-37 threonylcarbamoyl transferase component Bud32
MLVGKEIGPFLIEKELGSGAMGTVYRALIKETGQRVAFKIIGLSQLGNETAVARFEREAKILKQLKHPNITRLIATGHYQKTPFIAMELVEGESLDRVLARRSNFSWEEVVALGKQLCAALQHAHMKGIIHRDLKPSNVMVLPDGSVKLTDFGIAKDIDVTALTGANSTVGTAAYMSPEQCRGEKNLSPKSDLYSMGVMFFELLTGSKPFIAESPVDMFLKHVNEKPARVGQQVLSIPTWLDTLVDSLLEKKPEQRPFDAAMVAQRLEEIEQKAIEQRSAGIDAATARRIDRPRATADDDDREAARTLRSVVGRKKIRKKAVPLAQRNWFRASLLGVGLIALLGVVFLLTKPPSADKLYLAAKAAADSRDEDAAIEATERFLANHSSDPRAQEVRAWREQVWVVKRERQLFNRFERKLSEEDDGQRLSAAAMRYENDGDLENAERVWREMEEQFQDQMAPEPAVYGWVAKKKRADLRLVNSRLEQLKQMIEQQRRAGDERKPESEPEHQSLVALHFELFGDLPAARDRWIKIREQYLKPLDVRLWGILAADRFRVVKAQAVSGAEKEREFRLELLRARTSLFGRFSMNSDPTDKRQGRALCRDIIDLYGRDPDAEIANFATQAEEKLRELK